MGSKAGCPCSPLCTLAIPVLATAATKQKAYKITKRKITLHLFVVHVIVYKKQPNVLVSTQTNPPDIQVITERTKDACMQDRAFLEASNEQLKLETKTQDHLKQHKTCLRKLRKESQRWMTQKEPLQDLVLTLEYSSTRKRRREAGPRYPERIWGKKWSPQGEWGDGNIKEGVACSILSPNPDSPQGGSPNLQTAGDCLGPSTETHC